MQRKRHIPQPGDDMKFRLTVRKDDFQLSSDPWTLTVTDPFGRKRVLTRDDCFYDTGGRWYFTLENVRQGVYYARFSGAYEDDDYDKGLRAWNDRRELCQVGLPARRGRRCGCDGTVTYEQVWSVSVDGEDYLADCDGRYVWTSDGKRIQFTSELSQTVEDMGKVKMKMTGEEFLRLMEEKDPNSEINTIPELMDAMRGISDDTTVKEEIIEETEENTPERVSPEDLDGFEV